MSIEIENLTFTYGRGTPFETAALQDVSAVIRTGSITGIMGKTGCGKSTLMQLIAGLEKPEQGRILVDGKDINGDGYDRLELRRKVGVVFQYPETQLFETTVFREVGFGLRHSKLTPEEKKDRVFHVLTQLGFVPGEVGERSPFSMSGGEKRRLAIAGILAADPEYLFLDEPFAGLDPVSRDRFAGLIRGLHEQGVTVILISHNGDYIAELTEDLLVLSEGRIAASGKTRELFRDIALMESLGIGVSQSRAIAEMLREKGWSLPADILTDDELVEAVAAAKTEGKP